MKNLQKYICTIVLFMAVIAGCKQTNTLPANPQNPGKAPNSNENNTPSKTPDTNPLNQGDKGGGAIIVTFSLADDNGQCVLEKSGETYSATVKTPNAVLTVMAQPNGAVVNINGENTRTKRFAFAANGEEKSIPVTVTYQGSVKSYTVKIRYYRGAIKTLTVTGDDNKKVPVSSSGATSYVATVGTTKAKVAIETFEPADTVKIEGEETSTKEVEFTAGETKKNIQVVVTHNGKDEAYTLKLYYSDPKLTPKDPILTSLVIKNAADNKVLALSPEFQRYNTSYTVNVPSSVAKVKVEAGAESGIDVEVVGGSEKDLVDGSNVITVKATQVGNHLNIFTYEVDVRKAIPGASSEASIKALTFESKYYGISKKWITDPEPFSKTTYTYTCKMDSKCDEFFIKATPEDSGATMKVKVNDGTPVPLTAGTEWKHTPLKKGVNIFVITVTAADAAATKTYTINAEHAKGSYVLKTFSGTGLNDFYKGRFEEYKKSGTFGEKRFEATVDKTATNTIITAEPEFPDTTEMKITINGKWIKKYGKLELEPPPVPFTSPYTLDLTQEYPSQPGYVRVDIMLTSSAAGVASDDTYILWIKKVDTATGESENSLSKLDVSYYGGDYNYHAIKLDQTFAPETTHYTLTVPHGVQEIKVDAEPKSKKSFIDGWGGKTDLFYSPFSTVTIPVVAENGTRREYTITITERPATTIHIDSIPAGTVINAGESCKVTGTFSCPDNSVSEIWVGSSGLPIQQDLGGKWVKAKIIGSTFEADLTSLGELPNGLSDIKAGAFDSLGRTIAVTRVPITITGSSVTAAPLIVTIQPPPASVSSNTAMSIVVLDEDLWQQNENIIFASKVLDSIGTMSFPLKIPMGSIKAGRKCRVEVYIYEKGSGQRKDSLKYYGVEKKNIEAGETNTCSVDLKYAQ